MRTLLLIAAVLLLPAGAEAQRGMRGDTARRPTPEMERRIQERMGQILKEQLRLTDAQIARYVESREGEGKAGGYAIQGRAEAFVKEISGSYSNVVGLPLALTVSLLAGAGHG